MTERWIASTSSCQNCSLLYSSKFMEIKDMIKFTTVNIRFVCRNKVVSSAGVLTTTYISLATM